MDHVVHIYDEDVVMTLCKKRIQVVVPRFGDTIIGCNECWRINDKSSDLDYEGKEESESLDHDELIRVEALNVAIHIYPKELPVRKQHEDAVAAMVFRFANKCVDYIKHGFPEYDVGATND